MAWPRARRTSRAALRRSRPNSNSSSASDASTPATIRPVAIGRVAAFAQPSQHDAAFAQVSDRAHHFGGVAAEAVDADDHDGVSGARVVE
jgi:hypothetical protein